MHYVEGKKRRKHIGAVLEIQGMKYYAPLSSYKFKHTEMLEGNVSHVHNIRETVSQVSAVVDNNSATSEETAAVSEEQKIQVDTMVALMDKFVI